MQCFSGISEAGSQSARFRDASTSFVASYQFAKPESNSGMINHDDAVPVESSMVGAETTVRLYGPGVFATEAVVDLFGG